MDKEAIGKNFEAFCRGLKKTDIIAIVHHSDADGICAGVIAAKSVFRLTGKKPVFVSDYSYGDEKKEKKNFETMHKKKANKLICLDLAIDSPEKNKEKIDFLEKLLIIDHHQFSKDLNSEKTVFVNAKLVSEIRPSSYPAAKLTFDFFSKCLDIKDLAWIACVGIMGDKGEKQWNEFIKKTEKENGTTFDQIKKTEQLISAVSVVSKNQIYSLFWQIFSAKKPEDCFKKEFTESLKEFEEEKKMLLKNIDIEAKIIEEAELRIYTIKTRFSAIKSLVANHLSDEMPDKTVIVAEEKGMKVKFSARRKDFKVDLNKILRAAIAEIPDSRAGGHIPAAAGSVPKEYFETFEQNLIKELKKAKK